MSSESFKCLSFTLTWHILSVARLKFGNVLIALVSIIRAQSRVLKSHIRQAMGFTTMTVIAVKDSVWYAASE